MPTPAINALTAFAPPPATGGKATAAQSNFVETLQVAVRRGNLSPAPRVEEPPQAEQEEQPEYDTATVDAQQHSSDEENRTDSTEGTPQRDGEADNNDTDRSEQGDTEDTLVVSAAAEQVVVEEETAEQLSSELASAEQTGEAATDTEGEQQEPPAETALVSAITEEAAEPSGVVVDALPTEAETTNADEQGNLQTPAEETTTAGEVEVRESTAAATKIAEGESSDASGGSDFVPAKSADDESTTAHQVSNDAPQVGAAAEQQANPSDGETKQASRAKRGEPQAVEATPAPEQQSPELDTEQQTDLSSEGDADAELSTAKEKPQQNQQNSSSFNSLLERATGPTSRRGAETEQTQAAGPRVDPQRFVSRVTRAFQAAEQRGGSVQLRLAPPELGALRIELNMQNGTLNAKLETETAAAKNVLLDNLPALRDRLAAQDIRVDKFEVDVRQQNSGGQPDWQAQQQQQDAQHYRGARLSRPSVGPTVSAGEEVETSSSSGPQTNHDGQFSAVA